MEADYTNEILFYTEFIPKFQTVVTAVQDESAWLVRALEIVAELENTTRISIILNYCNFKRVNTIVDSFLIIL